MTRIFKDEARKIITAENEECLFLERHAYILEELLFIAKEMNATLFILNKSL